MCGLSKEHLKTVTFILKKQKGKDYRFDGFLNTKEGLKLVFRDKKNAGILMTVPEVLILVETTFNKLIKRKHNGRI